MTAPIPVKDEKVRIGEWWLLLFQLSGAPTLPDRQVTRESSFDSVAIQSPPPVGIGESGAATSPF